MKVNTDMAYTTMKNAFRAAPHPHLGSSDHLSVMLIPAPPGQRKTYSEADEGVRQC